MKEMKKQRKLINNFYTLGEEIFNSVSHGVGALLGIAALVLSIVFAALYGDAMAVVSASIYGASMVIMYCMSTLYHALQHKTAKKVFRIFDHCSIFLLIAGTYTPYTLVTLRGAIGWVLFGIVWASAILGIVFNSINMEKFKKITMASYILTGWVIIFAFKPLLNNMKMGGVILLLAGGVFYTLGVIFYKVKIPYAHPVWHLFVLAGSIFHFFSILLYVLPIELLK